MPGSTGRIQVDIRVGESEGRRLREALSRIRSVTDESGSSFPIWLLPAGDPPTPGDPLVVVGPDDEEAMLSAVDDGATGYIVAGSSLSEIETTLGSVAGGAAVIPPMMLGALLRHTMRRRRTVEDLRERLEVLTDREREVVEQLALGKHRRDIAQQLFISPETVRTHIQRAMSKLAVHSQNELMALLAPLNQGRT